MSQQPAYQQHQPQQQQQQQFSKKRDYQTAFNAPGYRGWGESNAQADQEYLRSGGGRGGTGINFNGQATKITVSRSELQGRMKSKLDVYNILTKEGQLYLPPMNECSMDFIKEILGGRKKVSAGWL